MTTRNLNGTLARMRKLADGRRDFALLERRRLHAVRLLSKGLSQAEAARQVGVHRQSVNRWNRQLVEDGPAALLSPGRAGRKPRLGASDLLGIEAKLALGPKASGYPSGKWTGRSVADLIEDECGVSYSTVHAWRILQRWRQSR